MSWGYWKGVLKNIIGFIPLGSCFYAYFSLVRHCKRPALITIILGATISLTIEVLQGLPSDAGLRHHGPHHQHARYLRGHYGLQGYESSRETSCLVWGHDRPLIRAYGERWCARN